jgi:hypothetical protein
MKSKLQPCALCARHIRSREERCPFCGTEQESQADTLFQLATASAVGFALLLGACEAPKPKDAPTPINTPETTPTVKAIPVIASSAPSSAATRPTSEPAATPVIVPAKEPQKKPKKPVIEERQVPAYGGPRPKDLREEYKPLYGSPVAPIELEDDLRRKR